MKPRKGACILRSTWEERGGRSTASARVFGRKEAADPTDTKRVINKSKSPEAALVTTQHGQ